MTHHNVGDNIKTNKEHTVFRTVCTLSLQLAQTWIVTLVLQTQNLTRCLFDSAAFRK